MKNGLHIRIQYPSQFFPCIYHHSLKRREMKGKQQQKEMRTEAAAAMGRFDDKNMGKMSVTSCYCTFLLIVLLHLLPKLNKCYGSFRPIAKKNHLHSKKVTKNHFHIKQKCK